MSQGWKIIADSISVEASGMVSANKSLFSDKSYGAVGCNNMSEVFSFSAGSGHVVAAWAAVADLTTGGEIGGIGVTGGVIGLTAMGFPAFRGVLTYKVKDANGGLILNKTYSQKELNGPEMLTDFGTALVDVATYDPNTPQYATLYVEITISGKIPNHGVYDNAELSIFGC